ncbi:hypothetical protein VZH09_07475 [Synechococcus elongatus IITB7]|uniref:hypothetical protein n=1 Tax=Synechococcus elongatus TaxID=32046 RepID=UPI0030D2FB2D
MANCPNCGSDHIELRQDRQVNWGGAMIGYIAFGAIGGAVGATSGPTKATNFCMDCGTAWQAADIFMVLQAIEQVTGRTLNLSQKRDRNYMNRFIESFSPQLEKFMKEKRSYENELQSILSRQRVLENPSKEPAALDKTYLLITVVVLFSILFAFGASSQPLMAMSIILGGIAISILLFFLGFLYESLIANSKGNIMKKKAIAKQTETAKVKLKSQVPELERKISEMNQEISKVIQEFDQSY